MTNSMDFFFNEDVKMSIKQVTEFHNKFGLPVGQGDELMSNKEAQRFRLMALREEIDELEEAFAANDRVAVFDALIDLVYFAHGTALFAGIDELAWLIGEIAVHQANMAKERATSADQSKRGTSLDVVKPEGWKGPEVTLRRILEVR